VILKRNELGANPKLFSFGKELWICPKAINVDAGLACLELPLLEGMRGICQTCVDIPDIARENLCAVLSGVTLPL